MYSTGVIEVGVSQRLRPIRFLPQFYGADLEVSPKKAKGPTGLCSDGINEVVPADFLLYGNAKILCRRHSGECLFLQLVIKIRYLPASGDWQPGAFSWVKGHVPVLLPF